MIGAGTAPNISWPEPEHLVVFSSEEIRLYGGREDRFTLQALHSQSGINPNAVQWHPSRERPLEERLVALGRVTGSVILSSFARIQTVTAEFVPKVTRSCTTLAWNSVQPAMLAAGYERERRDPGIYLWDVERSSQVVRTPVSTVGPVGEGCLALAWELPGGHNLAVGTSAKFLRLYDVRSPTMATQSVLAHPKGVLGVRFSPINHQHLLSFSAANEVKVWDVRLLRSGVPVLNLLLPIGSVVRDARWSPNGCSVAAASIESSRLNVWSIASAAPATPFATGDACMSGFASMFSGTPGALDEGADGLDHAADVGTMGMEAPLEDEDVNMIGDVSSRSVVAGTAANAATATATASFSATTTTTNTTTTTTTTTTATTTATTATTSSATTLAPSTPASTLGTNAASPRDTNDRDFQVMDGSAGSPKPETRKLEELTTNREVVLENTATLEGIRQRDHDVRDGINDKDQIDHLEDTKTDLLAPNESSEQDALTVAAVVEESANTDQIEHRQHHRYYARAPIGSFSWHPSESDRVVAVSLVGSSLEFFRVGHDIPVAWGGSACTLSYFVPSVGLVETTVHKVDPVGDDMKLRADMGYGISPQRNMQICSNHEELVQLWNWMAHMQQDPKLKYQGAISLFTQQQDPSLVSSHAALPLPVYTSVARSSVLDIISWSTFVANPGLTHPHRVAAIHVCGGHLETAVASLGASPGHESIALALAGYTLNNSVWSRAATKLASSISVLPCLGAVLRLLTCTDVQQLAPVLNDATVPLWDRLGIACHFLPDAMLLSFCTQSAQGKTLKGLLDAIVLTGLGRQGGGLSLLQTYVDRTHDVQSAALAVSAVVPSRFRDIQAERWVECYRQLLDRWGMWELRARLDVERRRFVDDASSEAISGAPRLGANSSSAPSQIYIRCNNCDQSLSLSMMVPSKLALRAAISRVAASRVKACPSPKCREALPRCVLCLLPMECAAPLGMSEASQHDSSVLQDSFFTFCTICRHGGHPDHLLDWFSKHSECPVSDCPCRCNNV